MEEDVNKDPLGFTKRTALLLHGLGASKVLNEIKKRNISTNELSKLTEDDLLILGIDKSDVHSLLKQLRQLTKRKETVHWLSEHKLNHFIEILKDSQRQLSLIEAYLAYVRLKLLKDLDRRVDNDCRISRGMHLATKSVLQELKIIKEELNCLKGIIIMEEKKTKGIYISFTLISVLGLAGSIILTMFKRS